MCRKGRNDNKENKYKEAATEEIKHMYDGK